MRFLLSGNSVMPEHQRVEKNENIAKTNIFNFVEFSFRHYVVTELNNKPYFAEFRNSSQTVP